MLREKVRSRTLLRACCAQQSINQSRARECSRQIPRAFARTKGEAGAEGPRQGCPTNLGPTSSCPFPRRRTRRMSRRALGGAQSRLGSQSTRCRHRGPRRQDRRAGAAAGSLHFSCTTSSPLAPRCFGADIWSRSHKHLCGQILYDQL